MAFVDEVTVFARGGRGGDGSSGMLREPYKPRGGPDGGDGGPGGDVVFEVSSGVRDLSFLADHPHQRATNGSPGGKSRRNGAAGADLVVAVPDGTRIEDEEGLLADLVGAGSRAIVARGGRGGRGGLGNASLANSKRKAPGFALLGEPGEKKDVILELKSVADAALVGFPSAGKSSLIAALSAARPKIADYPFTTLVPNLGVVEAGGTTFTVADVPGLIPGASQGKGLGLEFLRHVERCSVLVHVIDCATEEPGRDPLTDLDVIEAELEQYKTSLSDRPRLVVLNKIDVPAARELAELVQPDLEARGLRVFTLSAATREGLRQLSFALAEVVAAHRAAQPVEEATRIVLRPTAVDDLGFTVHREGDGYVVRGAKPERWIVQTDFSNDEAVGYLADRLARLGVEKALAAAGATPGCEVTIGAVTFDWEPTELEEFASGMRGQDARFEDDSRPRAAERRLQKDLRRAERMGLDKDELIAKLEAE